MTSEKGQESVSYETKLGIVVLLLKFTIVKIRGPNKRLQPKKNCRQIYNLNLCRQFTTLSYDVLTEEVIISPISLSVEPQLLEFYTHYWCACGDNPSSNNAHMY